MTTGTELGRPIEILLVEDNPGDVDLTREGLADGKLRNNLHVAGDGEEAMAFLRREGEHADMPMPDLILLDLNLPRQGRSGGARGDQGRRAVGAHSGGCPDLLPGRGGYPAELPAARQLLHLQADPVRRVRQGRQVHRGILVHERFRQKPACENSTISTQAASERPKSCGRP